MWRPLVSGTTLIFLECLYASSTKYIFWTSPLYFFLNTLLSLSRSSSWPYSISILYWKPVETFPQCTFEFETLCWEKEEMYSDCFQSKFLLSICTILGCCVELTIPYINPDKTTEILKNQNHHQPKIKQIMILSLFLFCWRQAIQ